MLSLQQALIYLFFSTFIPFPFAFQLNILILIILALRNPAGSQKRKWYLAALMITPLIYIFGIHIKIKSDFTKEAKGILNRVFLDKKPNIRITGMQQGLTSHNFLAEVTFENPVAPKQNTLENLRILGARGKNNDDLYQLRLENLEFEATKHYGKTACQVWKQSKVQRFTAQVEAPNYPTRHEGKLTSPAQLSGDTNRKFYCLYFSQNAL